MNRQQNIDLWRLNEKSLKEKDFQNSAIDYHIHILSGKDISNIIYVILYEEDCLYKVLKIV